MFKIKAAEKGCREWVFYCEFARVDLVTSCYMYNNSPLVVLNINQRSTKMTESCFSLFNFLCVSRTITRIHTVCSSVVTYREADILLYAVTETETSQNPPLPPSPPASLRGAGLNSLPVDSLPPFFNLLIHQHRPGFVCLRLSILSFLHGYIQVYQLTNDL